MHAFHTLKVSPSDNSETIRQAYLDAIRRHPPESDPKAFKRITHAYEQIDTEEKRIRLTNGLLSNSAEHFDSPMEAVAEFLKADLDPSPPSEEQFYKFLQS